MKKMILLTVQLLAAMAVAFPLRHLRSGPGAPHDYRHDLDLIEMRSTVRGPCTITPTQQAIDSFIEKQFEAKTPVAADKGAIPVAVMMVGGPGAGKSSCRRKFVSFGDNFVNIDLDHVLMTLFPNDADKVYDCIGSAVPILIKITNRAAQGKYNIVNDGTGRNKDGKGASYDSLAQRFKKDGYRVEIVAVFLPVEVALPRIKRRAEEEHRDIDLEYTQQTYEAINQLLPAYAKDTVNYDAVTIASNFEDPLMIYSRDGGCSTSSSETAVTELLKQLC